jgi:hypothetical protein
MHPCVAGAGPIGEIHSSRAGQTAVKEITRPIVAVSSQCENEPDNTLIRKGAFSYQ